MRKCCENLCFLRFCIYRRPQTCENTGFERIRITEPCVFTGLGPPMNAKPKKTQVFAAFSHGFLRMSLALSVFLHFSPFSHFRLIAAGATSALPLPGASRRKCERGVQQGAEASHRQDTRTLRARDAPPTTCQKTHNSSPRSYLRVFRTEEGGEEYD